MSLGSPPPAEKQVRTNWKLVGASFAGTMVFAATIVMLVLLHYSEWAPAEALGAAIVGMGGGWLVGVYTSPYGQTEKLRFSEVGKAMSAVAGGAAATQILNILVKAVDKGLLWTGAFWHPFLLFLGAFLVTWVVTYAFRTYTSEGEKLSETSTQDKPSN